ncbi:MAG TPA: serine hydrolase [Reyranella sp.]|jgi:beta-lactamase class C|nr:serine hydrolase [Reyranella sp.]
MATSSLGGAALAQQPAQRLIHDDLLSLIPASQPGGLVVGLRINGREMLYSAGQGVRQDSQFNIASLRKPFEATLLAEAVLANKLSLDDPVDKYVTELRQGGDIRQVTLGQLATHTSGLLLPQDHPPWPTARYTLASFLDTLKAWQAEAHFRPGEQHMYTHAGYILLQVALERALHEPIRELLEQRILRPLAMRDSLVPEPGKPPPRAVQGYDEDGKPVGVPGDQQTYYDFPGTGQMYSTASDLLRFLAANAGEGDVAAGLREAMQLAQAPAVRIDRNTAQGLAWEIEDGGGVLMIDKNGGLNNASAYMGVLPALRLSLVVLCNRGGVDVNSAGRKVLRELAARRSSPDVSQSH